MRPKGKELLDRLRAEVVVADGALGTLLYAYGVPLGTCYDHLNVTNPSLIHSIHKEYALAGAQVIETNTFGANAYRLRRFGLEKETAEINERGARLAVDAARGRCYVAGSVGPLGRRAGEELVEEVELIYKEAIVALAEGGVDLLVLETFLDLEELEAALKVALAFTDLPVVCELAFMERGRTARGVDGVDAVARLGALGAHGFGANCGRGPRETVEGIEGIVRSGAAETAAAGGAMPLSAMPNAGYPEYVNGRYHYLTTTEYMADSARLLAAAGVTLIGGCCGTGPEHIAAIAAAVKGRKAVPLAEARARLAALDERAAPLRDAAGGAAGPRPAATATATATVTVPAEPGEAGTLRPEVAFSVAPPFETLHEPGDVEFLKPRRDGRPPILVEIDPPKDLDVEKGLRGARALAREGVDAITVGDNPLAIMRMSNLAFGYLVQREAKVRAICHLSCRDRNLIGTQSDLMGAHALGIRAILGITGDPASVGNQPGATSVYDMNSFGLVELMGRMNRGENVTGEPLGRRTAFTVGVAFNPNGRRIDDQVRRLAKKVEMGAHFAQTQPCYDAARVREMYERVAPIGVKVFLGVLPLLSHRAAEFIHNEVPGIEVPAAIRERLKGLDKDAARRAGLDIAKAVIDEVFDVAHGYYLIPPLNNYRNALELIEHIRALSAARRETTSRP